MIKKKKLILVFLAICLQTGGLLACKYNIRDTGFVDLGFYRYQLYCYVTDTTDGDIITSFGETANTALADTNIHPHIVNIDHQEKHPAVEYIDQLQIKSFPSLVLVSPDTNSIPIDISKPGQPFEQTLQSAISNIVSSPMRRQILKRIDNAMAVVLLIEGKEPHKNKRVRRIAADAIEAIAKQMKLMPKVIAEPPALIIMEQQSISAERILLWSLGLEADKVSEPTVAVLYARVKLMGPVLKAEMITENILTNLLAVIGADCECGLDRRWMRGRMLPVKWDADRQMRLAKSLGFDPENPMIKLEVSRILRYDLNHASIASDSNFLSNTPIYSQQLEIEFDSNVSITGNNGSNADEIVPISTIKKQASPPDETPFTTGTYFVRMLYFIGGLSVLVIFTGIFIAIKALHKKS